MLNTLKIKTNQAILNSLAVFFVPILKHNMKKFIITFFTGALLIGVTQAQGFTRFDK